LARERGVQRVLENARGPLFQTGLFDRRTEVAAMDASELRAEDVLTGQEALRALERLAALASIDAQLVLAVVPPFC
jgi:hypothetical protein